MGILRPKFVNDVRFSQIFSFHQTEVYGRMEIIAPHFPLEFQRCSETLSETLKSKMMIIFLAVISQCSSFSMWEQLPDRSPLGDVPDKPGGVPGGFWGTLLGRPSHEAQHSEPPSQLSQQNSLRQSQTKSERLVSVQGRRKTLPSSLRALHTFNTEYEEEDYDYAVEDGEVFAPEESRADQVINTHQ